MRVEPVCCPCVRLTSASGIGAAPPRLRWGNRPTFRYSARRRAHSGRAQCAHARGAPGKVAQAQLRRLALDRDPPGALLRVGARTIGDFSVIR